MIFKRTDLPLSRDSHSRFLPWIIAFMVFLSLFGFASILVLNEVATRWNAGVSGTISIQIPAVEQPLQNEVRLSKVLSGLANYEQIEAYEVVTQQKVISLLEP